MGVFEAMRAAGYAAGLMWSAAVDSGRPRMEHRDYDAALRRAEDALVDAEAETEVWGPAERCDLCNRAVTPLTGGECDDCLDELYEAWELNAEIEPNGPHGASLSRRYFKYVASCTCGCGESTVVRALTDADFEDEAWDANEDFDSRRVERAGSWMQDVPPDAGVARKALHQIFHGYKSSPVEGSGESTGGVQSPPPVVPLSELIDRVADELRAQHQPNWLGDKVRATAEMLKTQGL